MSDTKRYVQPGWNPDNPRWPHENMSEKFLHKDRKPMHFKSPGRFSYRSRKGWYLLRSENEAMALEEALEEENNS